MVGVEKFNRRFVIKNGRSFFEGYFMAFDILSGLAGIPAKPYLFHNYIILLIALSVKPIDKIIEKIPANQNPKISAGL
jgi:hypothetical protein